MESMLNILEERTNLGLPIINLLPLFVEMCYIVFNAVYSFARL